MTPPSSPAPRAPSRELDAEIAERVMGWDVGRAGLSVHVGAEGDVWEDGSPRWYAEDTKLPVRLLPTPRFSTDLAAAWLVVQTLRDAGWTFNLDSEFPRDPNNAWQAIFGHGTHDAVAAYGATAPLAICLAALAALAPPRAPLEGE